MTRFFTTLSLLALIFLCAVASLSQTQINEPFTYSNGLLGTVGSASWGKFTGQSNATYELKVATNAITPSADSGFYGGDYWLTNLRTDSIDIRFNFDTAIVQHYVNLPMLRIYWGLDGTNKATWSGHAIDITPWSAGELWFDFERIVNGTPTQLGNHNVASSVLTTDSIWYKIRKTKFIIMRNLTAVDSITVASAADSGKIAIEMWSYGSFAGSPTRMKIDNFRVYNRFGSSGGVTNVAPVIVSQSTNPVSPIDTLTSFSLTFRATDDFGMDTARVHFGSGSTPVVATYLLNRTKDTTITTSFTRKSAGTYSYFIELKDDSGATTNGTQGSMVVNAPGSTQVFGENLTSQDHFYSDRGKFVLPSGASYGFAVNTTNHTLYPTAQATNQAWTVYDSLIGMSNRFKIAFTTYVDRSHDTTPSPFATNYWYPWDYVIFKANSKTVGSMTGYALAMLPFPYGKDTTVYQFGFVRFSGGLGSVSWPPANTTHQFRPGIDSGYIFIDTTGTVNRFTFRVNRDSVCALDDTVATAAFGAAYRPATWYFGWRETVGARAMQVDRVAFYRRDLLTMDATPPTITLYSVTGKRWPNETNVTDSLSISVSAIDDSALVKLAVDTNGVAFDSISFAGNNINGSITTKRFLATATGTKTYRARAYDGKGNLTTLGSVSYTIGTHSWAKPVIAALFVSPATPDTTSASTPIYTFRGTVSDTTGDSLWIKESRGGALFSILKAQKTGANDTLITVSGAKLSAVGQTVSYRGVMKSKSGTLDSLTNTYVVAAAPTPTAVIDWYVGSPGPTTKRVAVDTSMANVSFGAEFTITSGGLDSGIIFVKVGTNWTTAASAKIGSSLDTTIYTGYYHFTGSAPIKIPFYARTRSKAGVVSVTTVDTLNVNVPTLAQGQFKIFAYWYGDATMNIMRYPFAAQNWSYIGKVVSYADIHAWFSDRPDSVFGMAFYNPAATYGGYPDSQAYTGYGWMHNQNPTLYNNPSGITPLSVWRDSAHAQGNKFIGVIFAAADGVNNKLMGAIFSNPSRLGARTAHAMAKMCHDYNLDGFDINYEADGAPRDSMTKFWLMSRDSMRAHGLSNPWLSMTIDNYNAVPNSSENFPLVNLDTIFTGVILEGGGAPSFSFDGNSYTASFNGIYRPSCSPYDAWQWADTAYQCNITCKYKNVPGMSFIGTHIGHDGGSANVASTKTEAIRASKCVQLDDTYLWKITGVDGPCQLGPSGYGNLSQYTYNGQVYGEMATLDASYYQPSYVHRDTTQNLYLTFTSSGTKTVIPYEDSISFQQKINFLSNYGARYIGFNSYAEGILSPTGWRGNGDPFTYYKWIRAAIKNAGYMNTVLSGPALSSPLNATTGVGTYSAGYVTAAVSWTIINGATGYHLSVSKDTTFSSANMILDADVSNVSFTLQLDPSTKYYWKVASVLNGAIQSYSPTWSFTTVVYVAPQDTTAPSTPTPISPTTNATGVSATPTFSWSSITGASTYTLRYGTDSTFATSTTIPGITATTYVVTVPLVNGTRYFYQVRAMNTNSAGPYSTFTPFTTIVITTPTQVAAGLSYQKIRLADQRMVEVIVDGQHPNWTDVTATANLPQSGYWRLYYSLTRNKRCAIDANGNIVELP